MTSTFPHPGDSESSPSSLSACCPFHLLTESSLQSSAVRAHTSGCCRLRQDCWSEGRYLGQWTHWEVAVYKVELNRKEVGRRGETKDRMRVESTHTCILHELYRREEIKLLALFFPQGRGVHPGLLASEDFNGKSHCPGVVWLIWTTQANKQSLFSSQAAVVFLLMWSYLVEIKNNLYPRARDTKQLLCNLPLRICESFVCVVCIYAQYTIRARELSLTAESSCSIDAISLKPHVQSGNNKSSSPQGQQR